MRKKLKPRNSGANGTPRETLSAVVFMMSSTRLYSGMVRSVFSISCRTRSAVQSAGKSAAVQSPGANISCASSKFRYSFGLLRYSFQYASSSSLIRSKSIGIAASQPEQSAESVRPGISGDSTSVIVESSTVPACSIFAVFR